MPNCIKFISKETNKEVNFLQIDIELCQLIRVPVDQEKWVLDWYNQLGLGLAYGKTWEDLKSIYHDSVEYIQFIEYLSANYKVDAWCERYYNK